VCVEAQAIASSTVTQTLAVENPSLAHRVTLDLHNATIAEALRAIGRQTGMAFGYQVGLMDGRKLVTLAVTDVSGEDAVHRVLAGTGLAMGARTKTQIAIVLADRNVVVQSVVSGTVTDARTKQPLHGVTVSLDDTPRGVQTGNDGTYRLVQVTPGKHVVRARLIGYTKQSKNVVVADSQTTTVDFALHASASVLDQVVVTGTVVATSQREIPNAITVITAKDLEVRGITTLEQLFHGQVPGVYAMQYAVGDYTYGKVQMFSRGMSKMPPTSGYSPVALPDAMKTFVDGVELTDPSYLNTLDPKSIERIEILTGPQASTIYGSHAINGVMQVFLKHGEGISNRRWTASLMSGLVQNNYSPSLAPKHDYTVQLQSSQPGLSYAAGAGYQYEGEWTPGYYARTLSGFASGVIDVIPDKLKAEPSVRLTRRSLGHAASGNGDEVALMYAGVFNFDPYALIPYTVNPQVDGQTLGLGLTATPLRWWTHHLVVGADALTTGQRQTAGHFTAPYDTLLYVERNEERGMTIRYDNTISMPIGSMMSGTLTTGADYSKNTSNSYSGSTADLHGSISGGYPSISQDETHNLGYYGQGQLAIADALFLTAGLRAESNPAYGQDYGLNYTPRVGASLVHDFGSLTAKGRISYGKATRPPTLDQRKKVVTNDQWWYGGQYVSQFAAPKLGPEFQAGTEAGVELYAGNLFNLSITHYNQQVNNLIFYATADSIRAVKLNYLGVYPYLQQYQWQNVGVVKNDGWEAEARGAIGRFSARGTWSNTKSTLQTVAPSYQCHSYFLFDCLYSGRRLGGMVEHTGSLQLSYSDAKSSITLVSSIVGTGWDILNLNLFYFNWFYRNPTGLATRANQTELSTPTPAYQTLDLTASRALSKRLQMTLQVNNLANSYNFMQISTSSSVIGRVTMLGLRIQ